MRVSYEQVVAYRLRVNHLLQRLPAGEYERAAWVGLQDTGPRDALVGLHARVTDCEPTAWEDERLVHAYSPRAAVYLLPRKDLGVFTLGRLPTDPHARSEYDDAADHVREVLDGREGRPGPDLPDLRRAAATGRVVIRWTASAIFVREHPAPAIDEREARHELCRRHVHAFGPTTPDAFSWWSGLPLTDAHDTWKELGDELAQVDLDGTEAWILQTDKAALTAHEPPYGVRLLPASDVRLFGQDKTGLFCGPGERRKPPRRDWYHPHGVLVDGQLVGSWGRRTGRVKIRLDHDLPPDQRTELEREALTMPIPRASMSVEIDIG